MEEKERHAYEELMRQQAVKQDKPPFKEQFKEDWNVFLVLLTITLIAVSHLHEMGIDIFSIGR